MAKMLILLALSENHSVKVTPAVSSAVLLWVMCRRGCSKITQCQPADQVPLNGSWMKISSVMNVSKWNRVKVMIFSKNPLKTKNHAALKLLWQVQFTQKMYSSTCSLLLPTSANLLCQSSLEGRKERKEAQRSYLYIMLVCNVILYEQMSLLFLLSLTGCPFPTFKLRALFYVLHLVYFKKTFKLHALFLFWCVLGL